MRSAIISQFGLALEFVHRGEAAGLQQRKCLELGRMVRQRSLRGTTPSRVGAIQFEITTTDFSQICFDPTNQHTCNPPTANLDLSPLHPLSTHARSTTPVRVGAIHKPPSSPTSTTPLRVGAGTASREPRAGLLRGRSVCVVFGVSQLGETKGGRPGGQTRYGP